MVDKYRIESYNLYDILRQELNTFGTNWTAKEKVDYIYIRMCQKFNFDERWRYSNNKLLHDAIFDRELDITNIDLSKTVCNGFSRAFCDMLNILLADCDDFDMALTHGKLGHVYTYVYFKDFHCVYDSILPISDFMNVKLNLPLNGIRFVNGDEWDLEILQRRGLRKIGYDTSGIENLRRISNLIRNEQSNTKILDLLVENVDFKDLGMIEANKYLNICSLKANDKKLKELGIKRSATESSDGEISFIYSIDGDEKYLEKEEQGKVKFYKM